jgi:prolyl 4-hydroxylase
MRRVPGPLDRLAALDGAQRVPGGQIEMVIVREFLDPDTCAGLMARIDQGRRPSEISDDQGIAAFRTSETCDLDERDPLVARVDALLCDALGLDPATGEPIQGQRYAPGQEFRAHTDSFNPGGADYYRFCAEQGQRTWTAMVYLNRPDDGGATRFRTLAKTIQPEPGKLVAWNNLLADGSPNPATLHQGMKVRSGTKYIVTKWFREYSRGPGPA